MKKYNYITCNELENYDGWEIVQIIPATRENDTKDYVVIMKEDKSTEEVCLNDATTEQLLSELYRRLEKR